MTFDHDKQEEKQHDDDDEKVCPICFEAFTQQEEQVSPVVDTEMAVQKQEVATTGLEELNNQQHDEEKKNDQDKVPAMRAENNVPMELSCQHTFCVPCLLTHIGHSVETKQIPLQCPELGCREYIADDQLIILLEELERQQQPQNADLVERYRRLQQLAENPTQIPCTKCPALVNAPKVKDNGGDVDPDNNVPADLECPACHHKFCRFHGDMHPDMTCAAFGQTERGQQLRESEEALHRFTKPCSRCGALLQKSNGCDYVICGHCRKDMCYKCGTHEYLSGENFRRCTQCRSTYHNEIRLPMALGCLFLFVLTLFTIILVVTWPVVAGAVIICSGCCGCFFHCGRRLDSRRVAATTTPQPYRPLRGILAVVVILFLPLFMLADGVYMVLSGNEDGFLDGMLPEFSAKADEIPAMELVPTAPDEGSSIDGEERIQGGGAEEGNILMSAKGLEDENSRDVDLEVGSEDLLSGSTAFAMENPGSQNVELEIRSRA